MPATSGIFASLPTPGDLNLDGVLPKSVPLPSVGTDVGKLKDQLLASVSDPTQGLRLPDMKSGAPSAAGFQRALEAPLAGLTAVDGRALVARARTAIPQVQISRAVPDVNAVVQGITTRVLPPGTGAPVPVSLSLPAALGDFSAPLQRLTEAGAATPLRMLSVLLTVLDRFVATVTDAEKLRQFTSEAVQEILAAQVETLRDLIPADSLQQAQAPLDAGFLNRYEALLDRLERVQTATGDELARAIQAARAEMLPALEQFRKSAVTLRYVQSGQTDRLGEAVQGVAGFATTGDPFLADVFAGVEAKVVEVLSAIGGPVAQLASMIEEIRAFLQDLADQATRAAESVSGKLTEALQGVAGQLDSAEEKIREVEAQVKAFVEKVDVTPALEAFKQGCNQVVDGVDLFFTEVERVRQQLDQAVAQLDAQIRERFDAGLQQVKDQIQQLLDTIVGVLDRAEVKQVLDQARQGVEQLKGAIEQASLQQVFDLVVTQTGALEGKIQAIDTAKLGTPQKTALKVGVKVIKEVKIDEVIKPELQDAFAQILGPLRELVQLLKDKVLFVEEVIDRFQPGTLVVSTIEPYLKPVFDALDSFRPSQLLAPIQQALAELTKIVEKLDPQIVLDLVQQAYRELEKLVEALNPAPLTRQISGAANTAIDQLEQVRDLYLDELIDTIRSTISLHRLLEGTGLQEIADADFWRLLTLTLGGGYLDEITRTVDRVRDQLAAGFAQLRYADVAAGVLVASRAVDAQVALTPAAYRASVGALSTRLAGERARVERLEQRRLALLEVRPQRAEVAAVLREAELQPVLDLLAGLEAVAGLADDRLRDSLAAAKTALQPGSDALRAMREDAIRQAVPDIYEAQLAAPVRSFVASVQRELQPFRDAVEAIQEFLRTTLEVLPGQIDAAVATVLETIRTQIREVLREVIETIQAARDAIVGTIDAVYRQVQSNVQKMSPTLVLNSFVESDFLGAAASGAPRDGVLRLADAIGSPRDGVAPYLVNRLTEAQLDLVAAKTNAATRWVIQALNDSLLDPKLAESQAGPARVRIRQEVERQEAALKTAQGDAWIAARKALLRARSALRQMDAAQAAFGNPATREAGLIRLNRVILEAQYPDSIKTSLQGLHPLVVEQVAALYPEETVKRVDALYADIVARVKGLPAELIQKPLDEAFERVKGKLHETFDIQGLFGVVDVKLAGMEGDLGTGLDRLSVAYQRLLDTLDARLA